jgi:hypothetical protein
MVVEESGTTKTGNAHSTSRKGAERSRTCKAEAWTSQGEAPAAKPGAAESTSETAAAKSAAETTAAKPTSETAAMKSATMKSAAAESTTVETAAESAAMATTTAPGQRIHRDRSNTKRGRGSKNERDLSDHGNHSEVRQPRLM